MNDELSITRNGTKRNDRKQKEKKKKRMREEKE